MPDIRAIDELLESIEKDASSWTRRGVVKLVATQGRYAAQIKYLEQKIDKWTWRSNALQTLAVISAYFTTGGTGVTIVREAVVARDGSIEQSTLFAVVLIITAVSSLVVNTAAQLQSTLDYASTISEAADCINDLRIQINEINIEIYRKAETRTSLATMFSRLASNDAKIQRRLTNVGLRSYLNDENEQADTTALNGVLEEQRRHSDTRNIMPIRSFDPDLMTASASSTTEGISE